MIKGVIFALTACLIWGLIFVIPQFMTGFSSFEVALGRYLVYGSLSMAFFLKRKWQTNISYSKEIWIKALFFSLTCTIGYYTFLVLALRYATPAICALILGISPITIAFYGNWKHKETTFKSLILPAILVLIGLTIINIPHIEESPSPTSYILGLMCALCSLSAWSWYVVANYHFLKTHPKMTSSEWSTLIGVSVLFWVTIFALVLILFFEDQLHMEKYVLLNEELLRFCIGSLVLGLLCSWVGAFLWNKANQYIPVSLAGQLTVFETIFGVTFVYAIAGTLPSLMETIGIVILMIAVFEGIRKFAKKKAFDDQISPH